MAEKKASKPAAKKTIRTQYYHSFAGSPEAQKEIVRSLGFTRVNQIRELPANRSTLAATARVPHLLRIIE
jgi:large subunit ribosomal protein L30